MAEVDNGLWGEVIQLEITADILRECIADAQLEQQEDTFARACSLTTKRFAGVVDKGGNPYMYHCYAVSMRAFKVAVALSLPKDSYWIIATAGMLHDIVEDTDLDVEYIEDNFGYVIGAIVGNVSKRLGESREDYFKRVCGSRGSMIVKYADADHNSRVDRLTNPTKEQIRHCANYAKTRDMLGVKLGLV